MFSSCKDAFEKERKEVSSPYCSKSLPQVETEKEEVHLGIID